MFSGQRTSTDSSSSRSGGTKDHTAVPSKTTSQRPLRSTARRSPSSSMSMGALVTRGTPSPPACGAASSGDRHLGRQQRVVADAADGGALVDREVGEGHL